MKKQTAVEWLYAHLLPFLELDDPKKIHHYKLCLNEAIFMEKEQMEQSVSEGISNADMTNNRGYFDFEQYYNETYGKDLNADPNRMG